MNHSNDGWGRFGGFSGRQRYQLSRRDNEASSNQSQRGFGVSNNYGMNNYNYRYRFYQPLVQRQQIQQQWQNQQHRSDNNVHRGQQQQQQFHHQQQQQFHHHQQQYHHHQQQQFHQQQQQQFHQQQQSQWHHRQRQNDVSQRQQRLPPPSPPPPPPPPRQAADSRENDIEVDIVLPRGQHVHNNFEFLTNSCDHFGVRHSDGGCFSTLHVDLRELSMEMGSLSGLQLQYWAFKQQYYHCVLFIRVGMHYVLFHKDADVGVELLNLTYHKGIIAKAKFHHSNMIRNLNTLVDKQYAVAYIEECESRHRPQQWYEEPPKTISGRTVYVIDSEKFLRSRRERE